MLKSTYAPVRGLGRLGVFTDVAPFDLPANAWSDARNIRFDQGRIKRTPIFREYIDDLVTAGSSTPRFMADIESGTGERYLYLADKDGTLYSVSGATLTDVSPSVYTPVDSDVEAWTSTILADKLYLNRGSGVPFETDPGAANFSELAGGFDSNWRINGGLRAFNSQLIGVNWTKSGTDYPTLVKWSDYALAGAIPASWDETDPSVAAGETNLVDIEGSLVDLSQLGNSMILYANNEVWRMTFIGGALLYRFDPVFRDNGVLNVNCVVQKDRLHYVFGDDDIYAHDGVTKRSIAEGRVRHEIFERINMDETSKVFNFHDRTRNEILFCYNSVRDEVAFPGVDGANEAAVYNYADDTWSFMDLPNVFGMADQKTTAALTWSGATETWDSSGGAWADLGDESKTFVYIATRPDTGAGLTNGGVYVLDEASPGSVDLPLCTQCETTPYAERTAMDLDQFLGPAAGTSVYRKSLKAVYPQAQAPNNAGSFTVQLGGHDTAAPSDVTYSYSGSFDPETDYGLFGTRIANRYLAIKITGPTTSDVDISGIDLELSIQSKR